MIATRPAGLLPKLRYMLPRSLAVLAVLALAVYWRSPLSSYDRLLIMALAGCLAGLWVGSWCLSSLDAVDIFRSWRNYRHSVEYQENKRIAKLRRLNDKEKKRRLGQVVKVAKRVRGDVVSVLARYGICYIYERQGAVSRMSKPEIRNIMITGDAIYYRMDRLPFGKTPNMLNTDEMAHNVALAIGRECRWTYTIQSGLWLQVALASGLAGVPRFVPWHSEKTAQNAVELLPKTKPMTVAIGMGENNRFVCEDFRDWPHLLVAGATGGGKSNFMRQMLASLITRNDPDILQFVLIDLKGGIEFTTFSDIPHLREPVIMQRNDIPEALERVLEEKDRRLNLLRRAELVHVRGWNATRSPKLPYIVVVFDELANMMLDRTLKRKAERLVQDIAQQGRAVGIHLILCTQIPNRQVITTIIKGNIPVRLGFTTDMTGSILIVGNGKSAGLPTGGRAIYNNVKQIELQVPFIEDTQLAGAIQAASLQDGDRLTEQDLFDLALANYNGKLGWRELVPEVKKMGGSRTWVERIARQYEFRADDAGPVIKSDGQRYIVSPSIFVPGVGKTGRWLIPVNGDLPADRKALEVMTLAFRKRFLEPIKDAQKNNV